MTKKVWIIVAVLCAALLGGLVWISRSAQVDVASIDINATQKASSANGNIGDHTFGNMQSKVILIEYGDFQCPGCGTAAPIMKEVTEKYKDKLGFIFRNFPLYSAHPNAFAAASAAEAAGLAGKYWEMHDYLYANQSSWNQLNGQERTDFFVTAATQLGANGQTFTTNLTDPNVKKKIDFDAALGKKAGVSGTPSLYLNGENASDKYYLDGKLVSSTTSGAQTVWSNADAFSTLIIEPALKANGIDISSK